ncbi:aminopeptidase [Paenibacillus thiaminolyticus]|uniref:aminopeptidase n=1 Tax=Paenibacillus thiaminolyticus TaxID=49283 RepID=UPI002350EB47|nr:aminopeptidase [Paenibacillus thiaminolyticus]WCR28685.1 aminopeptidase [Paenibacillus thiaminolyticus]
MENFTEKLEKYAELAVKVGVNIQQGQTLVIKTTLDAAVLVRLIAKKAYEAGANDVFVQWSDDAVDCLRFAMAPEETLQTFSTWYAKEREEFAAKGGAFMSIVSSGPDWLQGIQPTRIASFNKAKATAMYPYSRYIQTDKVSWTMIAAPSAAWAATVFPDVFSKGELGVKGRRMHQHVNAAKYDRSSCTEMLRELLFMCFR